MKDNNIILAGTESLHKTEKALTLNGFLPEIVSTGVSALSRIKELVPEKASVMNGASRTLEEIGFIEYLKGGEHNWNNLHEAIVAETDPVKQTELRKQAIFSDFYLGSAHAVTETGELVIASATGSQLPHLTGTSPNVVLVVSTQKIVPTLALAHERIKKHVFPLEDERMRSVGYSGSVLAKELILHKEASMMGRKVHVLLVEEKLGF